MEIDLAPSKLSADAKQVGRLIGDIMKTHKGQVEAGDVKRIAEELLKG
jgi:Asp-tRNA(Asn)/Glu-tRNA(Gln) amidotransferase B subunit